MGGEVDDGEEGEEAGDGMELEEGEEESEEEEEGEGEGPAEGDVDGERLRSMDSVDRETVQQMLALVHQQQPWYGGSGA